MKKLFIVFSFIIILSVIGCAPVVKKTISGSRKIQTIEAEKAFDIVMSNRNNPDFIIIDVRTPAEYSEEHLAGAINIDYSSPQFEKDISSLDRSKIYLLYCKSSRRSENAIKLFREMGFLEAYHIFGGLNEWARKGYPVVK